MSNKKIHSNRSKQPQKLFRPKVRRNGRQSTAYLSDSKNKNYSYSEFKNTNLFDENSYRYGDKNALVSTQEINTDYSDYTNHTFFHSAVAKNNEFFDLVLNKYPYDGSNKKIEAFEDSLTGYEKHLYDQYPKNKGYLIFSGTSKGESQTNGTSISVEESSGVAVKSIASNRSGKSHINPNSNPLNVQVFVNLPKKVNDNQTIFQKYQSISNNFGLYLSQSSDVNSCSVNFIINSGSNSLISSITIPKGEFVHLTAEYHDCNKYSSLVAIPESFQKSVPTHLYSTSSKRIFFNSLAPTGSLKIGTGQDVRFDNKIFELQETFSGSMDEFRIVHRSIPVDEIKKNYKKSVSGQDKIALYFKFNEPEGVYSGNNIVLDSSGNSLSTVIDNYLPSYTRNTGSHDNNPMTLEKLSHSPVLFPEFPAVKSLHQEVMAEAEEYDDFNPNLITKLVPPHYLDLGSLQDGIPGVLGTLGTDFNNRTAIQSNQNTLTSVQILVKMLLTWGKLFDEIKIYVDHFSKLNFVEYEEKDTVSDKFLERLGVHLGLKLPRLFANAKVDQLIDGSSISKDPQRSTPALLQIQNIVWRRILSDIANIKLSKGNIDAIRSVFRSSGIEAENIFNFREYGGASIKTLDASRDIKKDVIALLDFSGSIGKISGAKNNEGYDSNFPYVKSPFLSGSRVEPGFPNITRANATGVVTLNNVAIGNFYNTVVRITDDSGLEKRYILQNTSTSNTGNTVNLDPGAGVIPHVIVGISGLVYTSAVDQLVLAIHSVSGHAGRIVASNGGSGKLNLKQRTKGPAGNTVITTQNQVVDSGAQSWNSYGIGSHSGFAGGIGFASGRSMTPGDGLFTTSSFALQGLYRFDQRRKHINKQSLFRLNVTGSNSVSSKEACIINAVHTSGSAVTDVYISDGVADTSVRKLSISASIMDGDAWSILLSRNDGINTGNNVKDRYDLSIAKYNAGVRQEYFYTSSFFDKKADSVLSNVSDYNTSGSFIVIGSQSLNPVSKFLNSSADANTKTSVFSGQVSYINFWSRHKTQDEFVGFAKNPESVGTTNPAINYNFSQKSTGSFERLRIHTIGKQATTSSDAHGNIRIFDFTQNNYHLSGKNFESDKRVFNPENLIFETLSPNFDLNSSKDKIRLRSLQDETLRSAHPHALTSPIYEIPPLEETFDDTRFSIDMSAMKGLNENIMTIFPDFQPVEDALGYPNAVFGEEYYDLRAFRRVYFNNLIDDLDLGRYRNLFKWIDNSYTDIIYSLIPRTTTFMGINFIYESHVLERNRFKYLFDEIYLKSLPRDPDRGTILLSQFVSKICKF